MAILLNLTPLHLLEVAVVAHEKTTGPTAVLVVEAAI
jgi:hypothetical protein